MKRSALIIRSVDFDHAWIDTRSAEGLPANGPYFNSVIFRTWLNVVCCRQ